MLSNRLLYLLLTVPVALAAKPEQNKDLFSMDLDMLVDIKVTTASKVSEKLSDAPSAMTVVTADEIKRFGGTTLREVLERVAGLTAASGFFGDHSLIAVRGDQTRTNGGHILMLINGRPTREILEGGISSDLLESFPVGALERIEVIKGPGSVLYGSDAYSGVINLITKTASNNGFHAVTSGGAGRAQAHSAEIMFRRGDFNLLAAGQFQSEASWQTPYQSVQAILPGPGIGRASSRNISLQNQGEGAYLGINYKDFSFMSSYTGWKSNSFVLDVVGEPRWRRGFADLGYHLRASGKWDMNFNMSFTRTAFGLSAFPNTSRDSHETVLEWSNFVKFSEADHLTFGILFNHAKGTETFDGVRPILTTTDLARSGSGFYLQQEHKLPRNLSIVGGFQAIKIGSIALNFVPRVGAVWNPSTRFAVKTLYGQAFRAPSLNEIGLHHPRLVGNPNLVPERVGTLDLGITFQGDHFQTGINYFDSRQADRIVQDRSTFPIGHRNSGAVTFRGIEAETKYYVRHDWLLLGSILNQVNSGGTADSPVTLIPRLTAKAGLSYSAASGFAASVFNVYAGRTRNSVTSLNPQPQRLQLLNSHMRYDFSKRWLKNDNRGFALFVHGDNLANKRVWLPVWGGGNDTMPVRRGRTVLFGLEVWIKNE